LLKIFSLQEWGQGGNFMPWHQIRKIKSNRGLITTVLPVWACLLENFSNVTYCVIYAWGSAKSTFSFHLTYILSPRRHIFSSSFIKKFFASCLCIVSFFPFLFLK
jgi:hypothetical protein